MRLAAVQDCENNQKHAQEEEAEVEVRQTDPREQHLDSIVDELELQHDFPEETVPGGPDLVEVERCV